MLKLLCNRMRRAITWKKRIGLSYLLVILLSKEAIQKKKAYQEDIQHFFVLKTSGNDNYLTVEHLDVRAYLSELYDQEYSRNSISRKLPVCVLLSILIKMKQSKRILFPMFI